MRKAYGEMPEESRANPEQRQWYAVWFLQLQNGEEIVAIGIDFKTGYFRCA